MLLTNFEKMKTEKEIKDRIDEISKKIEVNKKILKSPDISMGEAEDIEYDISDLYVRKKILEWVLS